jgi:hypothetical protein
MNSKSTKTDELEVSSGQRQAELIEIKERVGALETIASISNRDVVEKFVRDHITTDKARQILKECGEPRTRDYLVSKFRFASAQALDHHLNPLREANLIRQHFDEKRKQTFEWSALVRRLPKTTLKKILEPAK